MRRVYSQPTEVIVWRGPPNSQSYSGLDLLAYLIEHGYENTSAIQVTSYDGSTALDDIFDRPWWQRMWVLQDVALSQKARLVCGLGSLPWPNGSALEPALKKIEAFNSKSNQVRNRYWTRPFRQGFDHLLQTLRIQYHAASSSRPSLLELVKLTQTRECTDPRDRVFALIGLVDDMDVLENRPDYTMSLDEVKH